MECDDDPPSILSLPQHTLLQSENGASSSLSSTTSSTQTVDKDQQQWLQGAYTQGTILGVSSSSSNVNNVHLSTHSSSSFAHSFSLSTGGSNSIASSHQPLPHSSTSKYYGHSSMSSSIIPQSLLYSNNRMEQRFALSPTHFSEGGGTRSSNSINSSMTANCELKNANALPTKNNEEDTDVMIIDMCNNGNNNNNGDVDGNRIDQYYQSSNRNSSSMNFYGSQSFQESHYFDTGQSSSQGILGLMNYQHNSSSDMEQSVDKISKSHGSSRHQNHPNVEDVMEFSQPVCDPRSKFLGSTNSQTDIYHGGSPSKTSAMLGHEAVTSADKRQQDINLVTDFEFSLGAREFGPVGSSSSSNSRTDYISHIRSGGEDFRLNQDQGSDFLTQDLTHQRFPASSSQSQICDVSVNPRKMSSMHSDFSTSQTMNQNIYSTTNKSMNENHGSTYFHKDQISALRMSDGHKFSREFKKAHVHSEEIEQRAVNENTGTTDEKWSGRSRAHRKMARLLGQGSSSKEKSEKNQEHTPSSSVYQTFPKKSQNMTGFGAGFQEMHKTHEASKNYSLPETNNRDSLNSSSLHGMKIIDRLANSTEKSALYDRRDEDITGRSLNSVRDYSNLTTQGTTSSSGSFAPPSNQQLFAANTPSLDLEFQQSLAQRELELNPQFVLQVSKDLGMEENLNDNVNVNTELFSHHVDPHQVTQTNFPFNDNLSSQYSQDLTLESYLIPPEKDNGSFSKKIPYYNQRNIAPETEFNIEEYMEGQVDKDFTQAYFDRADNVPQDMTMYQKISSEKATSSSYAKFRERDGTIPQNFKASTTKQSETGNMCELQKELTKSSGKESMKGVRIPRDINRAMGILQDLQETEKEEEEKRKRELEKQQNNETQNTQNLHQSQQPQQQKFQQSTTCINSSPKKTFQNKHQIESMAAMTEQQLLSVPPNFIEDQSVENVNFLDQPSSCFPDQPTTSSNGFVDPNMQEMSPYSAFPTLYPPSNSDLEVSALSNKPRDYQQASTGYLLNQDLDYHILKRLAFSAANAKDLDTTSMSSSLQQHPSSIAPWLTGNPPVHQTDTNDLNFNLGIQRLPEHLSLLNEGPPPPSSTKYSSSSSNMEDIRGSQIQNHCDNLNYPDMASDQRGVSCFDPDKFQNFPASSFGDGNANNVPLPGIDVGLDKPMALDILEASRQNLYTMMKQEQLCDAVLSTSNIEVKVHQAILCSMSQYLSNRLLHPIQTSADVKATIPPSSSFSQSSRTKDGVYSNNAKNQNRHHLVMLVINCDNIKSSSISAFLMFIYLGKAEFSESNVLDLYVLASSLHVSTLKTLCLQFMWQTHISGDGVTIPSVQISKKGGLETCDRACIANLGNKMPTEDKAVYTGRISESADAASQTDQTACKVGGGGQDEWVMLKKTKQKTVSPSKSKINLNTKGIVSQDNNQPAFKPGKKSWLSPKRRFKSELLAQSKNDLNSLTKIKDKEDIVEASETQNGFGLDSRDIMNDLNQTSAQHLLPDRNAAIIKRPRMIPTLDKGVDDESGDAAAVKHIKTTVEIAEEAAAAKLSAATTSKSMKKGGFLPTSPSGIRHDHLNHKIETDSLMEENTAAFFQPEISSVLGKARQSNSMKKNRGMVNFEQFHETRNVVTIDKPVKKKIIQLSLNKDNSEMNTIVPELSNNTNPKKLELYNHNKGFCEENFPTDGMALHSNSVAEFPSVSEGDLSHVSCIIDSIVNTMGSETEVAELQKVIHDLDSELNQPQIMTPSAVTSCSVTLSSSTPLSSSELVLSSNLSSSCTMTNSTSAISTTSASSSTVSKSKSAAQGFRKRLIQLAKSENLKLSSSSSSSSTLLSQLPPSVVATQHDMSDEKKVAIGILSQREVQSMNMTGSDGVLSTPLVDDSTRSRESVGNDQGFSTNLQEYKKETGNDSNISTIEKGKGIGPADDYDTQFHHKIFKRKRKSKHRKTATSESDNLAPSLKTKLKKISSGSEVEGSLTKTRMRRNAATASDSETSVVSIGTRSKGKKAVVTESSEGGGLIRNVRPPPKKRAKMERELMKVTTGDSADVNHTGKEGDKNESDCGVERVNDKGDKKDKDSVGGDERVNDKGNKKDKDYVGGDERVNDKGNKKDKDYVGGDERVNDRDTNSKSKDGITVNGNNDLKEKKNLTSPKRIEKTQEINKDKGIVADETNKSEITANAVETIRKETDKSAKLKSKPAIKNSNKRTGVDVKPLEETKSKSLQKPNEGNLATTKDSSSKSKASNESTSTSPVSVEGSNVKCQYVVQLQKQFEQSGLKTRIFSCKLCKSHLKSALVSVKHAMAVHKLKGEEILQNLVVGYAENRHEACDICGYVTKDATYKYMHYHKYFKHNLPLPAGLTTHKCHLCSREFQTSYQLNEHVKGHDEDFSFTCWYCGQSFKSRNNMNNHVFHKHSKQRKHVCKICDKAFKTWTQLKIHVRIHTGHRPFTCLYCDHGCTTQGNMRHHLSHNHKMEKDCIEEAMVKISKKKKEVTPEVLDQLIDLIVSKAAPDKAKKVVGKRKGKSKTKKKIRGENNDKSSGEENIKSKTSTYKTKDVNKPMKSVVHNSTTTALKEKLHGNSSTASTMNNITSDFGFIKSNQHILILPKTEHVSNNKSENVLSPPSKSSENKGKESSPLPLNSFSSSSTSTQHQQSQKSITIISNPIIATNNNIILIPSGTAGKHAAVKSFRVPSKISTESSDLGPLSSNINSSSVSTSTSSTSFSSLAVSSHGSQSSLSDKTSSHQQDGEQPKVELENTKISLNSMDSQQQNDNNKAALPAQGQCNNRSAIISEENSNSTDNQHISSSHTAIPAMAGVEVLSFSKQQQQQIQQVVAPDGSAIFKLLPQPISNSGINNSQTAILPSSSTTSSSSTSKAVTPSPSLLPIQSPLLQRPIMCEGGSGQNAAVASNFVYATGPPIMLQNPMDGMGGALTMYQGLLPSFVMYPCQSSNSSGPQSFMQTQDVSGLMQIVPMAAAQGTVPLSVDIPLFQGESNTTTIGNPQPDMTIASDDGS